MVVNFGRPTNRDINNKVSASINTYFTHTRDRYIGMWMWMDAII